MVGVVPDNVSLVIKVNTPGPRKCGCGPNGQLRLPQFRVSSSGTDFMNEGILAMLAIMVAEPDILPF